MKVYPLSALSMLLYPLRWLFSRDRKLLAVRRRWTLECQQQIRNEKKLAKDLAKEAAIYAEIIQNCLSRLRFSHVGSEIHSAAGQHPSLAQRVQFQVIYCTQETIFLKVLLNRRSWNGGYPDALPFGVYTNDLKTDETCFELSMSCARQVEAHCIDFIHGFWFKVHRLEGVGGIPILVSFREMLEFYPADMSEGPMVLGVGLYHNVAWYKLDDCSHILIAGATRCGKSNLLNNLICSQLLFTDPTEVQMILIDLKRMELRWYRDDPHLYCPVIEETETAIQVMEQLGEEMNRRADLMSAADCKKLSEWNKQFPQHRLSRILLVIDEFAALMLTSDRKTAARVEALIEHTGNVGAATGIHIWLTTQMPTSSVITRTIRVNMNLVIAGAVATWRDSVVILGQAGAEELPVNNPKGRMLTKFGAELTEIQTPLISNDDLKWALGVSAGRAAGVITMGGLIGTEPTIVEAGLVRWLVARGGSLAQKLAAELKKLGITEALWTQFRRDLIQKHQIQVDNTIYRVVRQGNGDALVLVATVEPVAVETKPIEATIVQAECGDLEALQPRQPEKVLETMEQRVQVTLAIWRRMRDKHQEEERHESN